VSDEHIILGIHVSDRLKNAAEVQKVFTEYGCNIKTRIGLHDTDENVCSPSGVVLIEFFGRDDEASAMMARLNEVEGVQVQKMVFGHH
jgi:ACT domain-containing protein